MPKGTPSSASQKAFRFARMASDPIDILSQISAGDRSRVDDLSDLLYDDFRRLAASFLGDTKNNSLQPTAIVHEAFLKLANHEKVDWQGKSHFLAVGAKAMRQILVDHARKRSTKKRGGGRLRISLDEEVVISSANEVDVLAIHDALNKLAQIDQERATIVELRFYGGLSFEEVAEVMGISRRTIQKKWAGTKAWLRRELSEVE